MTLRLKIHLIVGVLVSLFVLAVIGLQLVAMRDAVREEVVAAHRVASQLLNRTVWLQAAQGTPAMVAYLAGIGRVRSSDITLVDREGQVLYRSPPATYKAGRHAPGWFERLVVPAPSQQSIAFPDGELTVRADASRAVLDAWDQFVVLAFTALALLVVVNAVVYAVVGRTVRPFGQIVSALNRLEAGRFDVALEPLPGREAAAIGAAFNRMVGVLGERLEAERRALLAEGELSDRRELARWIDRHLEQERKLIARELHDELGQSVTAIRSLALSVAQRTASLDPESAQAARIIADESSRLYDAMHGLIPRLAPMVLDAFGLADALRDLVERTRRSQPGTVIDLSVALSGLELGGESALALYRSAQEGLTNALRHGKAQRIQLALRAESEGAKLEVRDDGGGLPDGWHLQGTVDGAVHSVAEGRHYGLRWLRERVAAQGGALRIDNVAPRGALLQVWIPAEQAERGEDAADRSTDERTGEQRQETPT